MLSLTASIFYEYTTKKGKNQAFFIFLYLLPFYQRCLSFFVFIICKKRFVYSNEKTRKQSKQNKGNAA